MSVIEQPDGFEPYNADAPFIELTRSDGHPRVAVYRPARIMVVLGRTSSAQRTVNLDRCNELNIPVLRREGGGGTVMLDPGCIIVSRISEADGRPNVRRSFRLHSRWLAEALEMSGVPRPRQRGVSDLAIDDFKIAGSSMRLTRDIMYFTASIMVTPSIDLMEELLPHPPHEPAYRKQRPHRDFVRPLKYWLGSEDVAAFHLRLNALLEAIEFPSLTENLTATSA